MIKIISAWLKDLNEEVFMEILPLLRRSFSDYSKPERASIARIVAAKDQPSKLRNNGELNLTNVAAIKPILNKLLGAP